MSKRIITTILLLAFLIFNLTACFDTDDLFDKVVTPEGSVSENTEKSTTIAPTEKPTEETEPVIEVTEEPDGPREFNKTATFTASVKTAKDYSDAVFNIKSLLYDEPLDDPFYDKEAQAIRRTAKKIDVAGDVKSAYTLEYGFIFFNEFGNKDLLGDDMLMSVYNDVHIIDGSKIDAEHENSVFIAMSWASIGGEFKNISNLKFENGILTLNIDYFAMNSGDSSSGTKKCVIELDKSVLDGNTVTAVEIVFNGNLFFI